MTIQTLDFPTLRQNLARATNALKTLGAREDLPANNDPREVQALEDADQEFVAIVMSYLRLRDPEFSYTPKSFLSIAMREKDKGDNFFISFGEPVGVWVDTSPINPPKAVQKLLRKTYRSILAKHLGSRAAKTVFTRHWPIRRVYLREMSHHERQVYHRTAQRLIACHDRANRR